MTRKPIIVHCLLRYGIKNCWLWQTEKCLTIVNVIQNMPWSILVNLHLLPLVRQIGAKIWRNCGIYGKSTKFGTKIETYLLNNISYGPIWELPHNCSFSGFKVAHWNSSMDTRLRFCFSCCRDSPASKERQSSKSGELFNIFAFGIKNVLWLKILKT